MSRPRDPAERLGDANPVPLDDAPSPHSPQARALLERIVATPHEAQPERTRATRWRIWILVPVAILAVGAATYGLVREARQPLVIACYRQPSLGADRAILPATGGDPVATCDSLWRHGGAFNPSGREPVPPLAACVLPGGTIGVFPNAGGSDACSALGLAHPASRANRPDEQQVVLRLQNALASRFLSECVDRAQAIALAHEQLNRLGLDSWRVVALMPFTSREPCASAAYDVPHRTVSIVPVSDSTTP